MSKSKNSVSKVSSAPSALESAILADAQKSKAANAPAKPARAPKAAPVAPVAPVETKKARAQKVAQVLTPKAPAADPLALTPAQKAIQTKIAKAEHAKHVAAGQKAVETKKARAAAALPAEPVVQVEPATLPISLTIRELSVMKAVAASTFANPENGAVPSYTLALDCAESVPVGNGRVNSPIPGIVASLNKKGMFKTFKFNGQTQVQLTSLGQEYLEAAE